MISIDANLITFKQRSLAAINVNGILNKFVKYETYTCVKLEIADTVEKKNIYPNKGLARMITRTFISISVFHQFI